MMINKKFNSRHSRHVAVLLSVYIFFEVYFSYVSIGVPLKLIVLSLLLALTPISKLRNCKKPVFFLGSTYIILLVYRLVLNYYYVVVDDVLIYNVVGEVITDLFIPLVVLVVFYLNLSFMNRSHIAYLVYATALILFGNTMVQFLQYIGLGFAWDLKKMLMFSVPEANTAKLLVDAKIRASGLVFNAVQLSYILCYFFCFTFLAKKYDIISERQYKVLFFLVLASAFFSQTKSSILVLVTAYVLFEFRMSVTRILSTFFLILISLFTFYILIAYTNLQLISLDSSAYSKPLSIFVGFLVFTDNLMGIPFVDYHAVYVSQYYHLISDYLGAELVLKYAPHNVLINISHYYGMLGLATFALSSWFLYSCALRYIYLPKVFLVMVLSILLVGQTHNAGFFVADHYYPLFISLIFCMSESFENYV